MVRNKRNTDRPNGPSVRPSAGRTTENGRIRSVHMPEHTENKHRRISERIRPISEQDGSPFRHAFCYDRCMTLHATGQDQPGNHARKQHNTTRARVDGILLRKRDGQVSYIEYAAHFGLTYIPSIEKSPEQIQCRSGDSCITIEGRNLWPLFEDLQAKLCESVEESENPSLAQLGVMHIECITVRLWL
jgi:hypothetical protein